MANEVESTCTFHAVSTIGGGYLAVTWLFTRLILSQKEAHAIGGFGIFGLLIQLAFLSVFIAQKAERRRLLDFPKHQLLSFTDSGDVVLRMLTCLCWIIAGWFVVIALCVLYSCFPHVKFNPFSFPG